MQDFETTRLDAIEGALCRDIPPEVRQPGQPYVILRRFLPTAVQRSFEREYRQWDAANVYENGTAKLTEEQIEKREDIWRRQVLARVIEWTFKGEDGNVLPQEAASFDVIPAVYTDRMIAVQIELSAGRSEKEALEVAKSRGRELHGGSADFEPDSSVGSPNGLVVENIR